MRDSVNILVHIGAPATRQHDEKYKAQAAAYSAFDGRRIDITAYSGSLSDRDERNQDDETTSVDGHVVFLDDTQLAYAALDSQLQTSSLDIPPYLHLAQESVGYGGRSRDASPGAAAQVSEDGQGPPDLASDQQNTSDDRSKLSQARPVQRSSSFTECIASTPKQVVQPAPVSEESHSSYLKTPILYRFNKRPRTSSTSSPSKPSKRASEQAISRVDRKEGSPNIRTDDLRETSGDQAESNETTSELPTSYSLSDITTENSRGSARADNHVQQRSASDPGLQLHQDDSRLPAPDSTTNFEKEQCTVVPSMAHVPPWALKPNDTPLAVALETSTTAAPVTQQNHVPATLPSLPKHIRPPEPAVSLQEWTTHITPTLDSLSSNPRINKAYVPVSITRPLRPNERGCWVVDCSVWALQAQVDFWDFLVRLVGDGRCGWGVWCSCREDSPTISGMEAEGRQSAASTDAGAMAESQAGLGIVKVFCWGEVVVHMYLLLYTASKSQVRKLGLRWVDASGEVVVRMRKA